MKLIKKFFQFLSNFVGPEIGQTGSQAKNLPLKSTIQVGQSSLLSRLQNMNTIAECVRLYKSAIVGSSEEGQITEKIAKIAVSFADWNEVIHQVASDSVLGKRAIVRLEALAQDFSDWKSLYEWSQKDASLQELRDRCLAKMSQQAKSLEDWLDVYLSSSDNSEQKNHAVGQVCNLASTDDDWEMISDKVENGDSLHVRAVQKRLDGLHTIDECAELYDSLGLDDDTHQTIQALLARLKTCKATFEEWFDLYSNRSDIDGISDMSLEQALLLASEPQDYISLMEAAENSSEDAEKVKKSLASVQWSKEQWEQLRDDAESESFLECFAVEKLAGMITTVPELLRFLIEHEENQTVDDGVQEKIFARLFLLANPETIEIISILAENRDELREAAERHLKPSVPE